VQVKRHSKNETGRKAGQQISAAPALARAASCAAGFSPEPGAVVESEKASMTDKHEIYDTPHTDESGPSRRMVIATCLAGKFSGDVAMHVTPAEEKEYNLGMAMMAEMG